MLSELCSSKASPRTAEIVRAALSGRASSRRMLSLLDIEDFYDNSAFLGSEWSENRNICLSAAADVRPNIIAHPGISLPRNAIVIIGNDLSLPSVIMVWGDGALVVIGDGVHLPQSGIYCGGQSTIFLEGHISCAGGAQLNARNGGSIQVGKNGLWSNKIYMATDDMHAILDSETGDRINAYGGRISIGAHVWLGLEAMILGGADIGTDCVVGARSVVKGLVPDGSVAAGSPAKVVRSGVTWSHEDITPGGKDSH